MLASRDKIRPIPQFTRFSMFTFIYAAFLVSICFQYSQAGLLSSLFNKKTDPEVRFVLYTKGACEDGKFFTAHSIRSIKNCFDTSKKTVIIIHGFMASIEDEIVQGIKNALLKYDDVNIIGVDWCDFMSYFPLARGYRLTTLEVEGVGKLVGDMILQLIDLGMNCENVHLVGHSLGAHVAGHAGWRLKEHHHTAGRITGLDPAGPLYRTEYNHTKLSKDDAQFVDCIHTSICVGDRSPVCHADFYPNERYKYPLDCEPPIVTKFFIDLFGHEHSLAHKIFASSINPNHKFNVKCYECWMSEKPAETCSVVGQMGYYADSSLSGKFYTKTTDYYPYTKDEW